MSVCVLKHYDNDIFHIDRYKKRKLDSLPDSNVNNIHPKKIKIVTTRLVNQKKRKMTYNSQDPTIKKKKHISYFCCIHSHNKDICRIYDCIGITNNVKSVFNYFY